MRSGYLSLLLTLLSAALLLTAGAAGDGQFVWDVVATRYIQSITFPGLTAVVLLLNQIGATPVVITIAVVTGLVLAWTGQRLWALPIIASAGSGIANALLKALTGSPRPTSGLVDITTIMDGLGFPSGHVMGTVLFCGSLLYTARLMGSARSRLVAQIIAIFLMVAMGFSRIYVGAHWPSDILGAYLWGGFFLILLVSLSERWPLVNRSTPVQHYNALRSRSGFE